MPETGPSTKLCLLYGVSLKRTVCLPGGNVLFPGLKLSNELDCKSVLISPGPVDCLYFSSVVENSNMFLGMVVYVFNPSTEEAETGGSLSLRPA